jgi:predicted ATP-grasp superfamily ATP-dependent carboligase
MTRATTMEKLIRTASDQQHIEKLEDRVKHLETIVLRHKKQKTMDGTRDGCGADREMYEALGNCWMVDDE